MNLDFATEGAVDAIVARKLAQEAGFEAGTPYVCGGKNALDRRMRNYNQAARYAPWLVLRDQNSARCPGALAQQLVDNPADFLCLRVVPREIESWLMGDHQKLAKFLSIKESLIPRAPEEEHHPKQKMVAIARRSTRKSVRDEMVPRPGSGIGIGPNYGGLLIEFAEMHWRADHAARRCPALATTRRRLCELYARVAAV